jgi:hypothetical protein
VNEIDVPDTRFNGRQYLERFVYPHQTLKVAALETFEWWPQIGHKSQSATAYRQKKPSEDDFFVRDFGLPAEVRLRVPFDSHDQVLAQGILPEGGPPMSEPSARRRRDGGESNGGR